MWAEVGVVKHMPTYSQNSTGPDEVWERQEQEDPKGFTVEGFRQRWLQGGLVGITRVLYLRSLRLWIPSRVQFIEGI